MIGRRGQGKHADLRKSTDPRLARKFVRDPKAEQRTDGKGKHRKDRT